MSWLEERVEKARANLAQAEKAAEEAYAAALAARDGAALDALIRAVEKRAAERIVAEFIQYSGPDWEDAAALIDPDVEYQP